MSALPVFVYGSLKRGFENHARLETAHFLGELCTGPGYALFQVSRYPALVRVAGGVVAGELYAATHELLERLDRFEGCPWSYERRRIPLADGSRAFAYLMPRARIFGCQRLAAGIWPALAHRRHLASVAGH
jgi:gamma-glutamylcyclotransferase (GGCT)/AIG2-like uncharacterized protein YtfP